VKRNSKKSGNVFEFRWSNINLVLLNKSVTSWADDIQRNFVMCMSRLFVMCNFTCTNSVFLLYIIYMKPRLRLVDWSSNVSTGSTFHLLRSPLSPSLPSSPLTAVTFDDVGQPIPVPVSRRWQSACRVGSANLPSCLYRPNNTSTDQLKNNCNHIIVRTKLEASDLTVILNNFIKASDRTAHYPSRGFKVACYITY